MHKIIQIGVFCMLCAITTLFAAEPQNASEQIKKRLQEFNDAVTQNRADALAGFWTEDASLINPVTGEAYKGKAQITDYLKKRNQEIQERKLSFALTPININFPSPQQATVQAVVEVKQNGELLKRNARKIGFVQQNGQWLINDVREVEAAPPPPVYNHLKDLEWLIGTWKDTDQDVSITFSAKWDKFKNFIVQNFRVDTYGLEEMEGIQIIGWDPLENNIRSWVYDSDGGFGEGTWTKNDNGWQVALNYILSNGSEGTATNVFTDITDRTYRYSSINRTVNGEALDNIQPVTVKKE